MRTDSNPTLVAHPCRPSSHPPNSEEDLQWTEWMDIKSAFGSCALNTGLMIQWNVLRTELTDEYCGQIPSCCQSVHSCWLSCNGRVETWKSGPQPAFLRTCAAHWGFSQLAFGWSTLKLLHLLFPFLIVFLPFYAFAFFLLSNYNTAILWCFQEVFLGPPRIPKYSDKIFSCNICMNCWVHVASSQPLTW